MHMRRANSGRRLAHGPSSVCGLVELKTVLCLSRDVCDAWWPNFIGVLKVKRYSATYNPEQQCFTTSEVAADWQWLQYCGARSGSPEPALTGYWATVAASRHTTPQSNTLGLHPVTHVPNYMDHYLFTDPWGMDGWVGHVGWPIVDGLTTTS